MKHNLHSYLHPSASTDLIYILKLHTHTHTHTHNRFTALLEYVRDHPGEQVPER